MTDAYERVVERNPNEPEFHQAVKEVFDSLKAVMDKHPEFRAAKILERIAEPERVITQRNSGVPTKASPSI